MLLLHGAHAHALPMDASDPECAVSAWTSIKIVNVPKVLDHPLF